MKTNIKQKDLEEYLAIAYQRSLIFRVSVNLMETLLEENYIRKVAEDTTRIIFVDESNAIYVYEKQMNRLNAYVKQFAEE